MRGCSHRSRSIAIWAASGPVASSPRHFVHVINRPAARRIRSRRGSLVAAHASSVPNTSAITNEPRASPIVVRSVCAICGRVKAVR